MKRNRSLSPPTPARQLAGFIAKFDPDVARLIRESRRALRLRWPTAIEIVYDSYNALAIGFGPTERTSDAVVSLAAYARGVNLYFLYGAHLDDPRHVLRGAGTRGRFVPLTSANDIDRPEISALLKAAVRFGEIPMPASGRGRLVIKSVSAKQRPRRPPTRR